MFNTENCCYPEPIVVQKPIRHRSHRGFRICRTVDSEEQDRLFAETTTNHVNIHGCCRIEANRDIRRQIEILAQIVRRRIDRQLTKFVLTRVGFLIILLTPVFIYRIYKINIYVNPIDYF